MSPIAHPAPARTRASLVLKALIVIGALAASAAPAQAEFVTHFNGLRYGNSPAGSYKWYQTAGDYADTQAEYPDLNYVHSAPVGGDGRHHFFTFCIQKNVTMTGNPHEFNVVELENAPDAAPMTTITANKIRTMWGNYIGDLDLTTDSITVKNKKNAAFAHAIWHLLGQFDSNGDGSELSGLTKTYYLNYLNESHWNSTKMANLMALVGNGDQDQLIEVGGGGGNQNVVPLPPALVLALTGIVPCLALRRRVFGKKSA